MIDEEDDIIMIASDGVVIRLRASDIRPMSRYARGVRLMKLSGESKVVAFTRAERDESAETAVIEDSGAEEELDAEAIAALEAEEADGEGVAEADDTESESDSDGE